MAGHIVGGWPRAWGVASRDENGYREYSICYRVRMDSIDDGPALALQTSGLPTPGSTWAFGNDRDQWAFCKQNVGIKPVLNDGDPNSYFDLDFKFSTKGDSKRCKDQQIDDPLLEPTRISGKFVKYQEEATTDRFGRAITNSAWEQIRGPQVEFDGTRYTVHIEQNVAQLQIEVVNSMRDCLNQFPLWGFPPRKIKLTGFDWDRKFHFMCNVYYVRKFEFECRNEGFDRDILDEGTKVLHGHWDKKTGNWIIDSIGGLPPDIGNPQHFDRFKDRNGENSRVILNGFGLPAGVSFGTGTFHGTYACISENVKGKPPTNGTFWADYSGLAPSLWSASTQYEVGDAVNIGDDDSLYDTYLALFANDDEDPRTSNAWMVVATGLPLSTSNPFSNKGAWSVTTTYNTQTFNSIIDFVTYSTVISPYGPGNRHVEKYGEADFLELGVPTSF